MAEAENNLTEQANQAIDSTVAAGVEVERFENGKPLPAPGADDQKPNAADTPAAGADDKKPEQESPEKQHERELSRRQRARLRDAKALGRAEAERDAARAELERLKTEKPAQSQEPAEPKRENFESYEAYLEARADWRADQKIAERVKKDREEAQARAQTEQATQAQREAVQAWTRREIATRALLKDYDDTVTPEAVGDLALTDETRRAIVESERGPELLYHLITHPDDADRIADLPARKQSVELDKIEEALPKPGKKASDAPPPPNPPKGGHTEEGFSENMSQKEYEKKRAAQGSPWASLLH